MNARKEQNKTKTDCQGHQEEKMGVPWVLKWIGLERKWKFLKYLGPEGSWNKESPALL